MGMELFVRDRQQVHLTDVGANYAGEISAALGAIRQATLNAIANPGGGVLDLAILPTFGTRWLIPRLPSFIEENPGITVNFAMRVQPFDFKTDPQHAAIHYGMPDWPDADCTFLMGEDVAPVYSPQFAERHGLENTKDFANVPLLHLSTRAKAWPEWFEGIGETKQETEGMSFEQFSSVAQAAVAGLGAALLPSFLIENELRNGTLVCFEGGIMKSSSSYYLVTPKVKSGYAPLTAFRDWLIESVNDYDQR